MPPDQIEHRRQHHHLHLFHSFFLSLLYIHYIYITKGKIMSMNQLVQNPSSQAWLWQPIAMSTQHRAYYQVQVQQQGNYVREHMFEKPLTPSDVGKLNRLVIPKQHAEKYFPLDSESGEKGLLLSFEDESGKEWSFRYSYWTSSQSYVLTKGWSRYVKEKRLDAGDIVLFERTDDKLFIGCRRRGCSTDRTAAAPAFYSPPHYYHNMNSANSAGERQAGSSAESTAAATSTTGNSRRLRLFGVNLECGPDPQNLVSASSSQL